MATHRQRMIELLSGGTYTLLDLSSAMGLSFREVLHHLGHVKKSIRPPRRFIVGPAKCLECGFEFKDRRKLHSPSRCPKCKATHIQDPTYGIGDQNSP
jgi:predicted Zn-ribbon and HTH transcriptional regulator